MRVTLPNHFLTQYVNLCVTTFTCNCNIEVMNKEDFITFRINNTLYKVYMDQYSKLDTASLPSIIEDQIKIITDKITVSMTNIDTIKFICNEPFEIVERRNLCLTGSYFEIHTFCNTYYLIDFPLPTYLLIRSFTRVIHQPLLHHLLILQLVENP